MIGDFKITFLHQPAVKIHFGFDRCESMVGAGYEESFFPFCPLIHLPQEFIQPPVKKNQVFVVFSLFRDAVVEEMVEPVCFGYRSDEYLPGLIVKKMLYGFPSFFKG